jgi:hypothetical protein
MSLGRSSKKHSPMLSLDPPRSPRFVDGYVLVADDIARDGVQVARTRTGGVQGQRRLLLRLLCQREEVRLRPRRSAGVPLR